MDNHFKRVTETDALSELVEQSRHKPVVIFKHSTTCPISAAAYREMSDYEGDVVLVEVQRAPELSSEIENKTGVRHESPQVIILRNGDVVWNASHWKIKSGAVADAVRVQGSARRKC
jgi:monothiol bacilliredoxin